MDVTSITDTRVRAFREIFLRNRDVNKEVYKRIPEDKLDFRMVDTPERKSDSPRETIIHQIQITKKYIYAGVHGELKFDGIVDHPLRNPEKLTKQELLDALEATEQELVELLNQPNIASRKVKVPWSA